MDAGISSIHQLISLINQLGASEVLGASLAAVVEDELQANGHAQVDDVEDVGLDGSAEAQCRVEVHQPLKQRAALRVRGQADLDEVQHVGAHAELERVAAPSLAVRRRRRGRDNWAGAIGFAAVRGSSQEEAEGKEESNLGSHW